jgi:hypothetical protein
MRLCVHLPVAGAAVPTAYVLQELRCGRPADLA